MRGVESLQPCKAVASLAQRLVRKSGAFPACLVKTIVLSRVKAWAGVNDKDATAQLRELPGSGRSARPRADDHDVSVGEVEGDVSQEGTRLVGAAG